LSAFDELVGVLKAAGEITRLRLLALLAEGELSVKDLTDILGQSQPRVSRHLKLLADAGFVERHAEGAWAYYRLAGEGAAAELARGLVTELPDDDPVWSEDLRKLEDVRWAHQERAAAYFASVAEQWDRLRSLHAPDAAVEEAILEAAGSERSGRVLDLGTGTGRMLELLADRYAKGVGIDSSREMLGVARAKLSRTGKAQVRQGDIAALDPANGPADLIVLHQVLHYFDDPGRIIAEAQKLLSPCGRMLIVDFAPHRLEFLRDEHAHRRLGMSDDQMRDWATDAGLEVRHLQHFPSANGADGLTVGLWLLGPEKGEEMS